MAKISRKAFEKWNNNRANNTGAVKPDPVVVYSLQPFFSLLINDAVATGGYVAFGDVLLAPHATHAVPERTRPYSNWRPIALKWCPRLWWGESSWNRWSRQFHPPRLNHVGPPGPPDKVAVEEITDSTAQLSWTPGRDNGSPITSYIVQARTPFTVGWQAVDTGRLQHSPCPPSSISRWV